jgi:RNA polymerase sigma-70 factor, ECF subfamily
MAEDRRLLLRMHDGHEDAARELWRLATPRLTAYARAIVGSAAEDVVQAVFITVLQQRRGAIKQVKDPIAWLLVLTRRCALNHLRSSRRHAAGRAPEGKAVAAGTVAPAVASRNEDLHRAMDRLPRRLREVVVLRHMAGLTFDQVATALGDNRNTAAARYREAINRLRHVLDVGEIETLVGSAT